MMKNLRNFFAKFRRDTGGGTTVEFMIVMPLIMFWFAGTFTFFNAYSEWTRSVKATYTVADIMSRQLTVDEQFIEEMNTLYASIMGESANNVWLRISSIEKTSDGLTLDWTDATGLHEPLQSDAEIPVKVIPDSLQVGEAVVLVESYYPFVPFSSKYGIEATTLGQKIAILPRFNAKVANTSATTATTTTDQTDTTTSGTS